MADIDSRRQPLVLIVEDDPDIQRLLVRVLRESSFDVSTAATAGDGFIQFSERMPDAAMIDLMLPDGSGLGLVQQIRATSDVPVIVVTANDDELSLVATLDAGADDYITKPFRVNELLARVRSVLRRRSRSPEPEAVSIGSLTIDFADRLVYRHGIEVRLTPTEYRLLVQLARHPNRVFTHGALLSAVWGPEYADEPHILRVTLNRLRNKLGAPPIIENRPAVGYVLVPELRHGMDPTEQDGASP